MLSQNDEKIVRMKNVLEVIKTLLRKNKIIDANHFLKKVNSFTSIEKTIELQNEISELQNKIITRKLKDKPITFLGI